MKSSILMLILTFTLAICSIQAAKSIKSQHPSRRKAARPERQLGLFGSSDTETELDEASEHSHMVLVMNMMEKNSRINNIMKNVKMFSTSLDDLAEAVNTQIVQLASVANSNLGKNVYINNI